MNVLGNQRVTQWVLIILQFFFLAIPSLANNWDEPDRILLNGFWKFRKVQSLSHGVAMLHADSIWAEADSLLVPGNWDTEAAYANYKGIGLYFRKIAVPRNWSSLKSDVIRIRFEAVYETAHVYINGHYVGQHQGGYTPFEFRVDDLLRAGIDNEVAVLVDNSYRRGAWWAWGGISRDVSLLKYGEVRLQEVAITPDVRLGDRKGKLNIDCHLENTATAERTAELRLKIFANKTYQQSVADTTLHITLQAGQSAVEAIHLDLRESVKLWHIDFPNLYGCEVTLSIDGQDVQNRRSTFGFRKVEISGSHLLLNGEPIRLAGFNRIHDHRAVGNTEPFWLIKKDLDHMKSLGCNMMRMMHAPLAPELLDYADQIGMLIIAEIPVWGAEDPQAFEDNPLPRQWLREMIARDYNHPSIIGWSVANELTIEQKDKSRLVMSREQSDYVISTMRYIKEKLDHSRLVTYVSFTAFKDIDPEREPARHADLICINNYADFVQAAELVRDRWPDKLILITEFGQDQIGDNLDNQLKRAVGERLKRLDHLPYVAGASLWTYNDYRSDFKGTPATGERTWGVVDVWRRPKQAAEQIQKLFAPVANLKLAWQLGSRRVIGTIDPRGSGAFPSYVLKGYQLVLRSYDKNNKLIYRDSLSLRDIHPGDGQFQHVFVLPSRFARADRSAYVALSLRNPLGYVLLEHTAHGKAPAQPVISEVLASAGMVRIYFGSISPATEFKIGLPNGDTIRTVNAWVDVPKKSMPEIVSVQVCATNHLGSSVPFELELKFSGPDLAPMIRSAMLVGDGVVVGYHVASVDQRFRIQYRSLSHPSVNGELFTALSGAAKIRAKLQACDEVRIRSEGSMGHSQWSPWQKIK